LDTRCSRVEALNNNPDQVWSDQGICVNHQEGVEAFQLQLVKREA
jgi:hypothetical protein